MVHLDSHIPVKEMFTQHLPPKHHYQLFLSKTYPHHIWMYPCSAIQQVQPPGRLSRPVHPTSSITSRVLPVQSRYNYPTLGPSCMIPSYRVEYADREEGHPEEFLEDAIQDIRPITQLSVLPTSTQDVSTSYLNLSVFSHPSPTGSFHQERPTLSLSPDVTLLPSTPMFGDSDLYTPVYDSRQVSATLKPSRIKKNHEVAVLVLEH